MPLPSVRPGRWVPIGSDGHHLHLWLRPPVLGEDGDLLWRHTVMDSPGGGRSPVAVERHRAQPSTRRRVPNWGRQRDRTCDCGLE